MSVKIIAEIAQAHDGSLGTAHAYIDALYKTGVPRKMNRLNHGSIIPERK